jgi:hypothetical protein
MAGEATLSRDVALNVIGKIEAYKNELAKLPDVTAKAAAKSALAMQRTFTNDLIKQFKTADKKAEASAKHWEEVFSAVASNIGTDLIKGFATAAIGAKSEIASLTSEMAMYSRTTGLSLETVNALRFALQAQGLEMGELGSALDSFPDRLEDFRQGGGEVVEMFEILGFKVEDADKMLKDSGGTIEEVIRRLQGIENPAQRAGLASIMFGDAAIHLTAALGDVPLEEWADRAKVGVDVSTQAVRAGQDWTNTMALLGEAFTRAKQDATGLVDINDMVKRLGQVFVVFSVTTTTALDEAMSHWSKLITAIRMAVSGDLKSAGQALSEFGERGYGVNGMVNLLIDSAKAGLEAGRQFRDVADSIGNTSAEASGFNTKLGKTTAELDKAKQEAKKYADELDRLRKKKEDLGALWRDVVEDQVSAESKLRLEAVEREQQAAALVREGILTWDGFRAFRVANQERENRELAALLDEQLQDAEDFQKETQQVILDNQRDTADFTKEYYTELADYGFEYAKVASQFAGDIFGLMGDARQKDLDQAKRSNDKHKQLIDDLYNQRADAESKAELARIDSAIRTAEAQSGAYADGVKSARQAAKEVAAMQKGQAIFQIGLNTAQAVMMAWATVPPPFSAAAAILAGVAGATKMGIAAATPMPTFFGGTSRIPGMPSAGEVQVTAHGGEAMLNARASAGLGPQIIDALNAGLSPLAALGGGGGGDIYLDRRKVGRVMDRGARADNRKPTGFHSPFGRL